MGASHGRHRLKLGRRQGLQGFAQVPDVEVPVSPRRGRDGLVPKQALDELGAHASAQEQGCGRVPQVVEADRPHNRARPELHAAGGAGAQALVGVPPGVQFSLLPLAAPAHVVVALDEPGAAQRSAQHLLEAHVLAPHVAVAVREDQLALRGIERLAQVGDQGLGNGDGVAVPALRGVVAP
ncbi:MAG: hypothetical protein QM765_21075 [Myxococcales bacterium]